MDTNDIVKLLLGGLSGAVVALAGREILDRYADQRKFVRDLRLRRLDALSRMIASLTALQFELLEFDGALKATDRGVAETKEKGASAIDIEVALKMLEASRRRMMDHFTRLLADAECYGLYPDMGSPDGTTHLILPTQAILTDSIMPVLGLKRDQVALARAGSNLADLLNDLRSLSAYEIDSGKRALSGSRRGVSWPRLQYLTVREKSEK